MNELSARALETARSRGASYADVRIVRAQRESIQLKNGTVEALALGEEHGFGVRVIADGAWGFASSSILTADEVDRVAALAVQIARASARVARAPVNLGPPLREQGTYRTPYERDPFAVPLEEKLALLSAADAACAGCPA